MLMSVELFHLQILRPHLLQQRMEKIRSRLVMVSRLEMINPFNSEGTHDC